MLIRPPIVAGTFYPDEPLVLKKMIEGYLHQATVEKLKSRPKAIIVPHAGYIYSGKIAAYGFKTLENKAYEKVILLGPSHHFSFEGLASSPSGYWETPLGRIECLGKEDLKELKKTKEIIESSEIHEPEHCLEVEIPFLQIVLKNFKILPLLTGELNIKTIANVLELLIDEKTLILVSSDLSHYLPYNQAKMVDKVTIDAILSNDIQRFDKYGDACGKSSIKILLNIAKKRHWKPKLLCAMNSGETSGEIHLRQGHRRSKALATERFGGQESQVVGYASIAYYE